MVRITWAVRVTQQGPEPHRSSLALSLVFVRSGASFALLRGQCGLRAQWQSRGTYFKRRHGT